MSEVTRILDSIAQGDTGAAEKLLPLVYEELRRLAAHKTAAEAPGHTLQPTESVHEAWMRLSAGEEPHWDNPRPQLAVETIDFSSTSTQCAPFLIALTVE